MELDTEILEPELNSLSADDKKEPIEDTFEPIENTFEPQASSTAIATAIAKCVQFRY